MSFMDEYQNIIIGIIVPDVFISIILGKYYDPCIEYKYQMLEKRFFSLTSFGI